NQITDGSAVTATTTLQNSILSGSTTGSADVSDLVNHRFDRGKANTATVDATQPNIVRQVQTFSGTTAGRPPINRTPSTANPNLGALANNGGPTKRMPPGAGPAIATGNPQLAANLPADQRGFTPRVLNGKVDLGAVQVGAKKPPSSDVQVSLHNSMS